MPKLLMNCDQVFETLTRGPFPTGADSDEAVERHLRACHECRELAEALQPAVELLHEAIAPEDAAGLPEYQGLLATREHDVATAEVSRPRPLSVRRLTHTEVVPRRQSQLVSWARFAAALVLFAALGSLVWGVISTSKHAGGQRQLLAGVLQPSETRTPPRLDERGLMTLASLQLPAGCVPHDVLLYMDTPGRPASLPPASPPPAINQDALTCCTECHNAANPERAMLGTVVAMQRSCMACHHSL